MTGFSVRSVAGLCLAIMLAGVGVFIQPAHAFDCQVGPKDQVQAQDGRPFSYFGVHAKVLVNDFSDPPSCGLARSIGALDQANDFVEFGWKNDEGYGGGNYENIPFFWVVRGGVENHGYFTHHLLARGDDTNDFKLVNSNANHGWGLDLNGEYLQSVTSAFSAAPFVITSSERHNASDSLYAHFHGLSLCDEIGCNGGNFIDWKNTYGYKNSTDCWYNNIVSDTEVEVRKHC